MSVYVCVGLGVHTPVVVLEWWRIYICCYATMLTDWFFLCAEAYLRL